MRKAKLLLASIALLLISAQTIIETYTGRIVGVTDGDTITFLTDSKEEIKVRLDGIDCPETNQAYGSKAKEFTAQLAFNKAAKLEKSGIDKYGRTLGVVILENGKNLNQEILKAGYAWHYKKYNNDTQLADLESEARVKKLGLWQDSSPTAPWDFRRPVNSSNETTYASINTVIVRPPTAVAESMEAAPVDYVLICNSSSSYAYHRYECRGLARCTHGVSKVTKTEAIRMGRKACGNCY